MKSSSSDPLGELDRSFEHVQRATGASFFRALRRYRDLLDTSPYVKIVASLHEEAAQIVEEFERSDDGLVPEIVPVKAELVRLAPDLDDSDAIRPPETSTGPERLSWIGSFANFDRLAANDPDAVQRSESWPPSGRSATLLSIVEQRLHAAQWELPGHAVADVNQRPELDGVGAALRSLRERHRHAMSAFHQKVAMHGGFGLLVVDDLLAEGNPAPFDPGSSAGEHAAANEFFRRFVSGLFVVGPALEGREFEDHEKDFGEALIRQVAPRVEQLNEDLRRRLAVSPEGGTMPFWPRVTTWLQSPLGAILILPLWGQVVVQLAQGNSDDMAVLFGLALVATFVPPAWPAMVERFQAPPSVASRVMAIVAVCVVVVTAAAWGVAAGLLASLAVVTGAAAQQLGERSNRPQA